MSIQTTTYETQDMDDFIHEKFYEISKNSEENYDIVYENGNTYITKGLHAKTYPCVVAHTDTVHDIRKNLTVFEKDDIMFAMDMSIGVQVGVGGDDKVGIYVALEMLRELDVIKVAFFRDEEHGCLGSREANMEWFRDVEFVLQCDRQGYKDFVNTIYSTRLFDDTFSIAIRGTLKEYGKLETDRGGLTDVHQLVENGLDVCVANISCGYYEPHTDYEIIVVSQVIKTKDFVKSLIEKLEGSIWKNSNFRPYSPKKYTKSKGSTNKYVGDPYDDEEHDWGSGQFTEEDFTDLECDCSKCHSIEIMYDETSDADWCFECGEYTNFYDHFDQPKNMPRLNILEDEGYDEAFDDEDFFILSNGMTVAEYKKYINEEQK